MAEHCKLWSWTSSQEEWQSFPLTLTAVPASDPFNGQKVRTTPSNQNRDEGSAQHDCGAQPEQRTPSGDTRKNPTRVDAFNLTTGDLEWRVTPDAVNLLPGISANKFGHAFVCGKELVNGTAKQKVLVCTADGQWLNPLLGRWGEEVPGQSPFCWNEAASCLTMATEWHGYYFLDVCKINYAGFTQD